MEDNLNSKIIELESKIQILERENEALSAKAEENLLLNRAFEEINDYSDIDNLLVNTLESISIIMNVNFSGIFDLNANNFNCKSSYALFSNTDTTDIQFLVSESILAKLNLQETIFLSQPEFSFNYPGAEFRFYNAVITPFYSELIKNRYFVFVNDKTGFELENRIPVFEKIIRIISAKLDKLYFQNELIKLNEELERKVELRTYDLLKQNEEYAALNEEYKKINQQLSIAKEKAEESDRLKTAFLQNMSHEIRTPMNAIVGFSSLLSENFENKEKLGQFSKIISQRCNDLLDIINDILDIAKIESGQIDLHLEDCNAMDLFSDLNAFFNEYQIRTGKQHIHFLIQCYCDQHNQNFRTDKVKLKQILINLITNAFKFTNQGTIQCGCRNQDDEIVFFVSDTGIGIPENKHEEIFERFSQLKEISDQNIGGTGLGLAIVKALTNLLGGRVWLKSTHGKGTTFYFAIKKIQPLLPENIKRVIKNKSDYQFEDKTILIIEDDLYNQRYLMELLARCEVRTLTAFTGSEGIKIAATHPVDLVLMDIRLPDMSGYEATGKILKTAPITKIIAQTAYAAHEERQRALSEGCIDYISKPILRENLMELLTKHLK